MQWAVNCIAPAQLNTIKYLSTIGAINYVELTLDNFVHIDPVFIVDYLAPLPIAIHIVASRFLEIDYQAKVSRAKKISTWLKPLKPLYVSDHLLEFQQQNSVHNLPGEIDYDKNRIKIINAVSEWQALLGQQILFENHASIASLGKHQSEFFAEMLTNTGAGLLFDFSNAYIADYNNILPIDAWSKLLFSCQYAHVGGFEIDSDSNLALDTHRKPLSPKVIEWMKKAFVSKKLTGCVVEASTQVAKNYLLDQLTMIEHAITPK